MCMQTNKLAPLPLSLNIKCNCNKATTAMCMQTNVLAPLPPKNLWLPYFVLSLQLWHSQVG